MLDAKSGWSPVSAGLRLTTDRSSAGPDGGSLAVSINARAAMTLGKRGGSTKPTGPAAWLCRQESASAMPTSGETAAAYMLATELALSGVTQNEKSTAWVCPSASVWYASSCHQT